MLKWNPFVFAFSYHHQLSIVRCGKLRIFKLVKSMSKNVTNLLDCSVEICWTFWWWFQISNLQFHEHKCNQFVRLQRWHLLKNFPMLSSNFKIAIHEQKSNKILNGLQCWNFLSIYLSNVGFKFFISQSIHEPKCNQFVEWIVMLKFVEQLHNMTI